MRINVYAEEMTDRVEIIEKTTKDGSFTGLRIYLELPVTMLRCTRCQGIGSVSEWVPERCPNALDGKHTIQTLQMRGPFMHHPGDDDSSAVTFWGKRDLRDVLRKALEKLDEHYKERGR
jgi:hypothetical protein